MTSLTVQPLTRGQQLLLQRLLAAHIMSHKDLQDLFEQLQAMETTDMPKDCSTVEQCLADINRELIPGFGLEIATVVMNQNKSKNKNKNRQQYHAIINTHADDVAKSAFHHSYDVHQRAMIHLILQTLVQQQQEQQEDEDDDGDKQPSSLSRQALINLRSELKEPFKLTLKEAEHLVELLLEEEWLVVSSEETSCSSSASSRRRRRESSLKIPLEIGPRTFLELSHLLTDLGYPQEQLPQFIFHRM